MKEHQLVSDEARAAIVAAYQDGAKLRDIEQRFDVKRATIYWILEQAAVTPNRVQRGRRMVGDDQQLAQLYDLITHQSERLAAIGEIASEAMEVLGGMIGQHTTDIANGGAEVADWQAASERWEALEARLAELEDQE